MMKPKTQSTLAIGIMLMIGVVAMIAWPHNMNASLIVLGGVVVFTAVWLTVRAIYLRKRIDWLDSSSRQEILFAIILAGTLLLGSIIATLFKEIEVIDSAMTKRISGVLIGVMLICMGNYMPKKRSQSCGSCCGPSNTQSQFKKSNRVQRFLGWTFVIAGVLYAAVWLLVDLERTSIATMLIFPAAVLLIVLVRVVYQRVSKNQHTDTTTIEDPL